jgi:hypothetical protein
MENNITPSKRILCGLLGGILGGLITIFLLWAFTDHINWAFVVILAAICCILSVRYTKISWNIIKIFFHLWDILDI